MKSIDKLINELTIEEKAALLAGTEFWKTNPVPRLGIPSIYMTDGPHGLRKQRDDAKGIGVDQGEPATAFPTSATIASGWNLENAKRMGEAIAEECLYYKVNVLLGPGVNMKRNPLCGRNFEYYSEDPYLSGKMGTAFVQGVQGKGIGTSLKHFAANNNENYRFMGDSIVDERALREIYLKSFEMVVKEARPYTLMAAYNKLNGEHCTQNSYLLNKILRDEWGYDGLVMSDWGAVKNRVNGVSAGLDLDMPGDTWHNRSAIIQGEKSGELAKDDIDKAVGNVLALIEKSSQAEQGKKYDLEAHNKLACDIAKDCAVLLKNSDVLPLDRNEKILVIGDLFEKMRYQGAGSSLINPPFITTPKDAFDKRGINYAFERGYKESEDIANSSLIDSAVDVASGYEKIVLFAGLTDYYECEGFDRPHMGLPENQLELIKHLSKLKKRLVVVLFGGSPVELPFIEEVEALLNMYLPGQNGGEAAAALLFGEANPSGKLAETWSFSYNDVPFCMEFSKCEQELYRESIFVGYRYYDRAKKAVRFPFGYGLSYTKFRYSNLLVNEKDGEFIVTCDVTNIGGFDGGEIVQLYVKNNEGEVFKAEKELRDFVKLHIEKGETQRAKMRFTRRDLAYYNVDEKDWVLENGIYTIMVGTSSTDILLECKIEISGEKEIRSPYKNSNVPEYYNVGKDFSVSDKSFEKILGYKIPDLPSKKPITMESRFSDFRITFTGKILYNAVVGSFEKEFKQALKLPEGLEKDMKKKAALFVMRLLPNNCPRSLSVSSSGKFPYNVALGFVEFANGHIFRGVKLMLKREKAIPLPKETQQNM